LESAANTPSKQRHQGEEPGYRVYPEQYVSVLSSQEDYRTKVCEHESSLETPANEVADDVLYSLSEYWPGMPRDCDVIRDNNQLGLPAYRSNELRFGRADPANNKAPIDATATIQQLVALRAIFHLSNR
jgi:hypothetical protein